MLLLIFLNQLVPLFLELRAAIDRLTEMRQRFIGNIKLFVFGPTEMPFRFAHSLFARRVAVGFARARRRHAITNYGLD